MDGLYIGLSHINMCGKTFNHHIPAIKVTMFIISAGENLGANRIDLSSSLKDVIRLGLSTTTGLVFHLIKGKYRECLG